MSICIPNPGPWTANSRVGATLLAPVSDGVRTTGLSAAAFAAALGSVQGDLAVGRVAQEATATPNTHKYMNRPGSPPRGLR